MSRFAKSKLAPLSPLLGRGWVLAYWLEQQIDPESRAFVTGDSRARNLSGRNWTLLGAIGSSRRGVVDPRGLVVAQSGRCSVDWWVRANDRWYFPSRGEAVTQRLVDQAPVVETTLRIDGGEVIHRAFVTGGADEHVVIEIQNNTDTAVAVALCARPYDHESQVRCDEVSFDNGTLYVDGVALISPDRDPGQVLASNQLQGDVAERLDDPGVSSVSSRCVSGLAHGALVFPLVKDATMRARVEFGEVTQDSAVTYKAVASGWAKHVDSGLRLTLPDGRLGELVESNRRSLHLFADNAGVYSDPMSGPGLTRAEMFIISAMQTYGFTGVTAEALLVRCDELGRDGSFSDSIGELSATGAVLGALGDQYRLTRDVAFARATIPAVTSAAAWIESQRRKQRKSASELTIGLMPSGPSPREEGKRVRYLDDFWTLRGLRDAEMLLEAAGEHEAASSVRAAAADLRVDLLDSLERVVADGDSEAVPSGPDRIVDETAIESLSAAWPCEVLRYDHPMVVDTVAYLQNASMHSDAHLNTIGPRGLGTYRTMRLAMAEMGLGDKRALRRLDWMVSVASDTGTWPDLIHPGSGTGCDGPGHSGLAAASFLLFVRELLLSSTTHKDGIELQLLRLLPTQWIGQDIEVHDAPSVAGKLSYVLRWHGRRPLLLWELSALDGIGPVTIRVPGVDADFSTQAHAGEILLKAPSAD